MAYMPDKNFTEAHKLRISRGLVVGVSLILVLTSLVLAGFLFVLGVGPIYICAILFTGLLAAILTRRQHVDFPFFPIASTGGLTALCPNCRAAMTMPGSTALLTCADCLQWIKIVGTRLFKVEREEALLVAVEAGLTETVKVLLNEETNVEAKDRCGVTVLQRATGSGYIGIVKLLLSAGANVNSRSDDNSTALIQASQLGRSDLVNELLKAGADVNAKNDAGLTALNVAQHNRFSLISKLLRGADHRRDLR